MHGGSGTDFQCGTALSSAMQHTCTCTLSFVTSGQRQASRQFTPSEAIGKSTMRFFVLLTRGCDLLLIQRCRALHPEDIAPVLNL